MRRFMLLLVVQVILSTILSPAFAGPANTATIDPPFVRRWARDDALIASGEEQRTWTWGPLVLRSGSEPYAQAPNGERHIWYLDKARMEITHPERDPDDDWYVTSGLLVRELISGQLQLGDGEFENRQPAAIPVAGDLDVASEKAITYADLRLLASISGGNRVPAKGADQAPITSLLNSGCSVSEDDRFASYGVRTGAYDDVTGHNIATVFLDALPQASLLYVAGRPLTEPYWTRAQVAREQRDVLIQAFERRVLTYTPANPEAWRVEWGNVGRQYAQWRYGQSGDATGFDPNTTVEASGAVRQLADLAPRAAEIALNRSGSVGVAAYQTDTGAFYSFQGTEPFPMFSTVKVPIMLAVLDRALREGRRVTDHEHSLIKVMIQVSDNGAASQLLAEAGGAPAVTAYLRRIGITNTTINGYAWGASTTTAQDMARLMGKLGNCTILAARSCRYALDMMQGVVPSQKWGVSGGVPSSATVALKNGWYPQVSGWGINSIGLVTSSGKRYAIAVFTNPNPSMAYGIETIEQISAAVYPAVR